MRLFFTKMQGLGNDFVVVDATQQAFNLSAKQIQHIADRHFGVGCDQLLVIAPASENEVDFDYRIFNADGSEAEQCGNGARCIARYIHEHGLSKKKQLMVLTRAGKLALHIEDDGQVSVNMGMPKEILLNDFVEINNKHIAIATTNMGNPHAVLEVEDILTAPLQNLGPLIEKHPRFPFRTNVEFMQIINPNKICLRVFERGVGETLACGTGACAAVVVGRARKKLAEIVTVHLPGGDLTIRWQDENSPVWMTGPATEVFAGEITF